MSIGTHADLDGLRAAGRVVAETIAAMREHTVRVAPAGAQILTAAAA
jgi:hypothetical protein